MAIDERFCVMTVNPVLSGFHPDPSAICVDGRYYLAVSTFEWFPGVEILESDDLVNWRTVSRPLDNGSLLDMSGEISSDGIWAPNLSWHEGTFYLVYTDMKNSMTPCKDLDNWLITATDIHGPWSERIYLNSTGFDPALFHDDDGRKYLINMNIDYRPGNNRFGGILLQEYNESEKSLIGRPRIILQPNDTVQEGSNLYKIDGYYYLMIADGGTGPMHATILYRSESIYGPYEPDPDGFMLTSRFNPEHPIQCAGHACLLRSPEEEWFILHLGTRPERKSGRTILGRECFLERVVRNEAGWFRLANGSYLADVQLEGPDKQEAESIIYDLSLPLHSDFYYLRQQPSEEMISRDFRPGWLTLFGARSPFSNFSQALLARRFAHFDFTVETLMEFRSDDYHKSAGLIALYDNECFYYLFKSYEESVSKEVIRLYKSDHRVYTSLHEEIYEADEVRLGMSFHTDRLQFYVNGAPFGEPVDATILSNEYCNLGRYTGAMCGICAQDITGSRNPAFFRYFTYSLKELY